MDLRPFALALVASAAQADCGYPGTDGYDACTRAEYLGDYPMPPKREVSHDIYVRDGGQVNVYEHDAITPGDNLRVYDYESSMRVDGGGATIQQNPPLNTYKPWE